MGNGLGSYQRAGHTAEEERDEERGEAGTMDEVRGERQRLHDDGEEEGSSSSSSEGEESEDEDGEEGEARTPSSTASSSSGGGQSSSTTLSGPTTINFAAINSLASTVMGMDQHAAMQPEWPTQRLVPHPPKVHQTRTVKCDVNLSRETLRLVPIPASTATSPISQDADVAASSASDGNDGNSSSSGVSSTSAPSAVTTKYQLEFNFDANVECRVKVFFAAREKRDEDNHLIGYTSANDHTNPPPVHFPSAGLKQQYFQPLSHPFDVSLYSEEELIYDPHTQTYPVIISIEPIVTSTEQQERVSSQTTFATLLKCSDGSYVIKPVKIKIEFRGATYVVYDIFGLDKDAHGDTGKECVVCMTDVRDTVVLPCRHMCLCRACAEVLRYQTTKCPICRSAFTSLLKIEASKDKKDTDSDEETSLKRKKKSKGKRKHKKKDKEREKDETTSTSSGVAVEN